MARPLREQVVVLTGASSGIGRATAVELGRRGAAVVLAGRGEDALRDAAREVEAAGGRTLAVPTDVGDWNQVQHLAAEAERHFGGIDTWVNDAAVSLYGTVEDAAVEEIAQVFRVNLLGAVHGMKAALPALRRRGGGTIVNVSSVLGELSVPLQAAYCASKHGLIGFTDSLRLELRRAGAPIEVVTVLPSSINTPLFDQARARLGGRKPMPLPPAYEPEAVAGAIVHACTRPQRDIVVGAAGKLFILLNRVSPALLDLFLLTGDAGAALQTSDRAHDGRDNLFAPLPGPKPVRGSFGARWWNLGGSAYTRWLEQNPPLKAVAFGVAAVAAVGALGWLASSRSRVAAGPAG